MTLIFLAEQALKGGHADRALRHAHQACGLLSTHIFVPRKLDALIVLSDALAASEKPTEAADALYEALSLAGSKSATFCFGAAMDRIAARVRDGVDLGELEQPLYAERNKIAIPTTLEYYFGKPGVIVPTSKRKRSMAHD